jgi:hypothetical protein
LEGWGRAPTRFEVELVSGDEVKAVAYVELWWEQRRERRVIKMERVSGRWRVVTPLAQVFGQVDGSVARER